MSRESLAVPQIPTPDAIGKRLLARTPSWMRQLVASGLAVLAWISLPPTVLSMLSSLSWVVTASLWLYYNAGALAPWLAATGEGIVFVVGLWRGVTHPMWQAVASWFHFTMPPWAPDFSTLGLLLVVGFLRPKLRAVLRHHGAQNRRYPNCDTYHYMLECSGRKGWSYVEFFPEWSELSPVELTKRIRVWEMFAIEHGTVTLRASEAPTFRTEIRSMFERYRRSVFLDRLDPWVYSAAVALVAIGMLVDWFNAGGGFSL